MNKKLKSLLFFSFFSISFSTISSSSSSSSSLCPIDLSYVETFPWDTSLCREPVHKDCCQTLLSLVGMGMAQHLKDTSTFQLPNANASSSCLSALQPRLAALSVSPSLVPKCFQNSTQLAAGPAGCAGIVTTEDWAKKAATALLNESCKGDLMSLTRCSACLDAGMRVNSQLTKLDPNATKCFHFTVLYAAGIVNVLGPRNPSTASCILGLPLRPQKASKGSSRRNFLRILFGCLGAAVGLVLAVVLIVAYRSRRDDEERRHNARRHEEFVSSFRAKVLPNSGAKWFRLSELERATDRFSQLNMVGRGAHGVVYKGHLSDGTLVAVKQVLLDLENVSDNSNDSDGEFRNEVEIISKIRHRNLLSLRGCCVDAKAGPRQRFLVYDFMPNGSLGEYYAKKGLTWPQRKSIILDVAKGLAYLHDGVKPAIYHRDIKATNILLDSDMRAKVADFGLAKQTKEGQSHLTTRVAGTHGYMAPEYALYGQLTEKSDVYSLGIVVLEIMSGKKALDVTSSPSVVLIADWAWSALKSGNVDQVFDEAIRGQGPRAVMERFVRVGILCAHVMVAFRPTVSEALRMLEGDIDIPRLPERPLPLGHELFGSGRAGFGGFGSERSRGSSSTERSKS